jgi:hypothetical protein
MCPDLLKDVQVKLDQDLSEPFGRVLIGWLKEGHATDTGHKQTIHATAIYDDFAGLFDSCQTTTESMEECLE